MKSVYKLSIFLILFIIALLVFPSPVLADDGKPGDNNYPILGGTYLLKAGEVRNGDLVIFGGAATLEKNSNVNGDILVVGSNIVIFGNVNGNVTSIGSTVYLGDTAVISGDVIAPATSLKRAEKAVISGNVVTQQPYMNFNVLTFPHVLGVPLYYPQWLGLDVFTRIPGDLISALILAGLAALAVLLFPKAAERVSQTIMTNPLMSGGMGCLTFIVIAFLVVLLAITIVLIPISLGVVLAVITASLFGWFILGLEIGKRLAMLFKVEWAPAVSAGVGVLILTVVFSAINNWVKLCCLGVPAQIILIVIGLGGVVMTIFSLGADKSLPPTTRPIPPSPPMAPITPTPSMAVLPGEVAPDNKPGEVPSGESHPEPAVKEETMPDISDAQSESESQGMDVQPEAETPEMEVPSETAPEQPGIEGTAEEPKTEDAQPEPPVELKPKRRTTKKAE